MSNKTKKQLLLNLPYFIAGLVCTNLGEAWRIAEGADMSEKLLGFLSALGAAFSNPMPSLHPMDLLIGVCYVYMVKRYELLRLSRSDLFDSHLLRRSMKLCGENCDIEGAEGKGSKNNMTPEVIAVMKMTMLKAGLSMAFMSSLVNIGSLTLQTAINRLGQDIIVAHTAARKISEIFMVMFTVFGQTNHKIH